MPEKFEKKQCVQFLAPTSASSKPTTELAQPRLSRVKGGCANSVVGLELADCLFSREKVGTVCTNCSEIVCANCVFIWVGVFLGGGSLPFMNKVTTKWDKRVSAKFCGFPRFSAKICGFLRFSAKICFPKCYNSQEKWLRLSHVLCPS